ncbi:transketolase [Candidatus Gottesmanbacteria bacterium]|nr:transketolase [Candidatus Gottesmanbacteria bacterium]
MKDIGQLKQIAREVRKNILTMSARAKSAHMGGALSVVEILVTLYYQIMKNNPKNPEDPKRDRLILSKAHDAKALFAVLAECGYFDKKILEGYEMDGGILAGHSVRHAVPGVEASAGALGHGLSIATGVALAGKKSGQKYKTYAILSDGECDEGSIWEAALFAGHHALENLVVVIDHNKLQGYGYTKDVLNLEPFAEKWESFGFGVKEVEGHDMKKLSSVFSKTPFKKHKPSVVIAHTIKGLGGMKQHIGQISSQYKPPTQDELADLLIELEKS